ncbi:MAG: formaldehyde-activating enzyme [Chloroflexi bacterium]|nr:formaldehyde-activating enzyme [Chloroflexota bacterium]
MSKKPEWFKGIFPALATPFTRDDRVDEEAFRMLIRHVLPHVDGVVPAGTTGEFVYLTEAEKRRVIDIAVDEVGGRVPVVAGTGCASTRDTVALTQYAKDAGATAALVVAPFYFKPTFNEVYEHYEAVNEVGLPIILYNIPQCAGTHFQWWTAEGMAYLDNVVGIKDSSGDAPFLMALFEKIKGQVGIFCGHDEIVVAALAAGADGAILASANLIPDIWQKIYSAVQEGDLIMAQDWQARVQKLVRIIMRKGATQAVKEGLRMMGLEMGNSRHPIMPGGEFEREDYEELRVQLEGLGKIPRAEVQYDLGQGRLVKTRFFATPQTPRQVEDFTLRVGEGFSGPPFFEIAHIDLLLGVKEGPVGKAIARALGEPRPAHELRIISERPRTLLVPTVTVRTKKQAGHVYDDAARGISLAIEASIEDGSLPEGALDDLAMIANVFVHPAAANRKRIEFNNYKAMRAAIRKAIEGRPTLEELLNEKEAARHPFRYAP